MILECITILLYGVVFYRYYSKQRLRKSMDVRDRARSDLYLAQLRSQSAPNTPGFGPLSPSYSQHIKSPRFPPSVYNAGPSAEEGFAGTRFVEAKLASQAAPKPFALQPPPIKIHAATPKTPQNGFEAPLSQRSSPPPASRMSPPPPSSNSRMSPPPPAERRIEHVAAAPGEQTYDAVPIPGAYASPLASPGLAQLQHQRFGSVGQAITSERRIESPPGSPRGWN